jgi:hypothetical protein
VRKITTGLIIILSLYSIRASAQIAFGPKAAIQYYKTAYFDQDDKEAYTAKSKLGYNVGVFVIAPLKNHYALISELGFSRKGKKNKVKESDYFNNSSYNFLEASLLVRRSFEANLIEKVPSTWYINMGPNIQYWLGGKGEIDTVIPVDYKLTFDSQSSISADNIMTLTNANRILFGLDFGVGINIAAGRAKSISAELRYTYGHTFLGQRESAEITPDFIQFEESMMVNYRVFQIVVAYNFEFDYRDTKKGKSISNKVKRKRR